MKGYTEIVVSVEDKVKLEKLYKHTVNYEKYFNIEDYTTTNYVSVKGWFSSYIEEKKTINFDKIEDDLPVTLNISDLGFLAEGAYDLYLNCYGKGLSKIIDLIKINNTILLDDELCRVYNKLLES